MLSFEKRVLDWIETHKFVVCVVVVSIFAFFVRCACFNHASHDYIMYLHPWYETIKDGGGLSSLSEQVGNYNIPYQFLIAVMTYIPVDDIVCYKMLSVVFDYLLAFMLGYFSFVVAGRRSKTVFIVGYSACLFCPTVILNSASWAQCDSIYGFFVLWSLLLLYEKKDIGAFIAFGVAFAFKLQAVFFLPVFIYIYIVERRFSMFHFLIPIVPFYTLCIPGFIFGRSLLDPLLIYVGQAGYYDRITLNMPNFWAVFECEGLHFGTFAIVFTLSLFVLALLFFIGKKGLFQDTKCFFELCVWSSWTAVTFLPFMHERYTYVVDIVLILLAIFDKRYSVFAVISVLFSLVAYNVHLCDTEMYTREFAMVYVLLYAVFTFLFFRNCLTIYRKNIDREGVA